MTSSVLCRVLLLSLWCMAAGAEENDVINLHYDNRPPLIMVDEQGHASGILAEPVVRIFAQARLRIKWQRTPNKRARTALKMSTGNDCSFGWYKTAERETFAVFSLPYYLDKPPAGLVRADFVGAEWSNAAQLLGRPNISLTLRDGVAYGEYIDRLIDRMPQSQVTRLNTDSVPIAKMIHTGHTDLTILPLEEVSQVISSAGLRSQDFRILFFVDLPHQDYRYVVCSRATDPQVVLRINKAIKEIGLP